MRQDLSLLWMRALEVSGMRFGQRRMIHILRGLADGMRFLESKRANCPICRGSSHGLLR